MKLINSSQVEKEQQQTKDINNYRNERKVSVQIPQI